MSIYQGDTKISGNAMMVALPMFFATYQPRKLNNPSWLRAEPYSWHSADLYVSAYAHLADNISGVTAETETIAGTTITFYKLSDEIKVVFPDQQTNLDTIYNATGIGYYFVLDTTNRQFKLPRNIYGFTGYRGDVGGYVAESLPNVKTTATVLQAWDNNAGSFTNGPIYKPQSTGYGLLSNGGYGNTGPAYFNLNTANGTYQDNAPVQERATQAYLYFYVGNTVQNETLVDVGEMTEAINDKLDLDVSNATADTKNAITGWCKPSNRYIDLTLGAALTWYQAPANGMFSLRRIASNYDGQMYGVYSSDGTTSGNSCLQYAISTENADVMILNMPVKKGQYVRIDYVSITTDAYSYFRFIYDEGEN